MGGAALFILRPLPLRKEWGEGCACRVLSLFNLAKLPADF